MTTPRFRWPTPGTCRVCGCTEARACSGGCGWAFPERDRTLCPTCAGTKADMVYTLAWIQRLPSRWGRARDVVGQATLLAKLAIHRLRARQRQG